MFNAILTNPYLILIPFAVICFIQNMAFTWSSRSRNSGDPDYHRKASWASNGVYYITNALLTIYIVKQMAHGWWPMIVSGIVYTLTTAEGSVLMMRQLLKKEEGKRKVGNQFSDEEVKRLKVMLSNVDELVATGA